MLAVVRHGPGFLEKSIESVQGDASRLPWTWDGLCFAVPFDDPTRDSARDSVANAAPSATNGLTWARDPRGNTAAHLGSLAYIEYPDNPIHSRPATALTAYVRMRRAGTPDGWVTIFTKKSSDTDSVWEIGHGDPGGAQTINGQVIVGGVLFELFGSYPLATTEWVSVFLRWQSGNAPTLDVLGERGNPLDSTSYGSAATGSLSYVPGWPVRINSWNEFTSYNADYSQVLVWSRRLSDAELQALVGDPFGWYAPRRETVVLAGAFPFVPGAGEMRMTGMTGGGLM